MGLACRITAGWEAARRRLPFVVPPVQGTAGPAAVEAARPGGSPGAEAAGPGRPAALEVAGPGTPPPCVPAAVEAAAGTGTWRSAAVEHAWRGSGQPVGRPGMRAQGERQWWSCTCHGRP